MHHLNIKSCPANADVLKQPSRKVDEFPCYDYILLYTYDTLDISENAKQILTGEIGKYSEPKKESVGQAMIHLGGHAWKVKFDNMVIAWHFSSSQYVRPAFRNVEEYLKTDMS